MTEPVTAVEQRDLPSLTSLRWYAALIVFIYHSASSAGLDWHPLRPFSVGYVGVTFFFVLSGFVLTWAATSTTSPRRFYFRRFARIYPAHLAMFLVTVAFAIGGAKWIATGGPGAALQLTLTQAWTSVEHYNMEWNNVSWSLSDEAFFYLVFPLLLIWFRRASARTAAAAVAAALAAGLVAVLIARHFGDAGGTVVYYNPLARLPEFVLGMWLAHRLRTRTLPRIPLALALGAVVALGLLAWKTLDGRDPLADYVVLPGFAAVIVAGSTGDVSRSAGRLRAALRHPVSQYLGRVSFAFYLVHFVVIEVLLHEANLQRSWGAANGPVPTVVEFGASLAAAAALHHAVEDPARRWLMRREPARAPS